jgi:hypothetical protein
MQSIRDSRLSWKIRLSDVRNNEPYLSEPVASRKWFSGDGRQENLLSYRRARIPSARSDGISTAWDIHAYDAAITILLKFQDGFLAAVFWQVQAGL